MDELKPGQIITPRQIDAPISSDVKIPNPDTPNPPTIPAPTPPAPVDNPEEAGAPAPLPPADTAHAEASAPAWQFTPEIDDAFAAPAPLASQPALAEEISWSASEFIAHDKGAIWYGALATGGLLVAAVVYVLTKDKISTAIIVLAALAFGVFAARKPKVQEYSITDAGLRIGQKWYSFEDFRTFSVTEDGAIASLVLMPLKRFMPPLTVYVAPENEEKVIDFLSAFLPYQEHKADAVDSLLKRIRF